MLLWLAVLHIALVVGDAQESHWGGSDKRCRKRGKPYEDGVFCSLPSGNLTLSFHMSSGYLDITCEKNATIVCEELLEAKPFLDEYQDTSENNTVLKAFQVVQCELPRESLACAPGLVGAGGSEFVHLVIVAGKLEAVHLDGLKGVTLFMISYKDILRHNPMTAGLGLWGDKVLELTDDLFTGLHELQKLYILGEFNVLKLSNKTFSNLPSLSELQVTWSTIEHVPAELFQNSTNLKKISLVGSNIKYLPKTIFKGLKLTHLSLKDNSLRFLYSDVFSDQTSMTELDLSNNMLKSLPDGLFSNTHSLQTIYLDSNRIEFLTKSTFEGLYNLKKLSLTMNRIENISQWIFECSSTSETNAFTFPSAAEIDLRHNLIRELEPPVNKNYTIRARFLLGDNPYRCDCFLYGFVDYYRRANLSNIIIEEAECAEPDEMKGKSVVHWQLLEPECEVDCATGGMIKHSSKDQNCKCTLNPIQLRLDMLCDYLPKVFPKLPQQIYSTYLKLRNVTNIPKIPPEVKIIDFSSTNLTDLAAFAKSVVLNLTNNYFTKAPLKLFENNCSVYLSNNPFDCSCKGRDSVIALDAFKNLIPDYENLTCSNGDYVSSIVPVIDDLCAADDGSFVIISVSIGIISILVIFFICFLLAFKYRTELRIILRRLGLWRGDVHGGELYDAFVSYAHQDENFVIEELLHNLERGNPPLKICIHNRDWVVGEYIPAQIARSVEQSRYTIIVLSRNFVNSVWGRLEFQTAHAKDRVIILMLEDLSADKSLDPELRAYFVTKTYVKADDPLVWERLRDSVLHRKRSLKITNENQQLANMVATTNV